MRRRKRDRSPNRLDLSSSPIGRTSPIGIVSARTGVGRDDCGTIRLELTEDRERLVRNFPPRCWSALSRRRSLEHWKPQRERGGGSLSAS
jgi:hypothetical protein